LNHGDLTGEEIEKIFEQLYGQSKLELPEDQAE
jgi:hypothetical protein